MALTPGACHDRHEECSIVLAVVIGSRAKVAADAGGKRKEMHD